MTEVEHGHPSTPHTHVPADERHIEAPLLQVDLASELSALRASEQLKARGHAAKTLAKYPDLRIVLLAFDSGARMEEHQTKGRLSVHVLEGKVKFKLGAQSVELAAGSLLEIAPNTPHDVEAAVASAILLTIAWPVASA